MHIIAPDPDSHDQHQATQDLFVLLFVPLLSISRLPSSWPTGHYLLRNPPLYSAFNALAAYLLRRKPSKGRPKPSLGVAVSAADVMTPSFILLHTTLQCLQPLSTAVDVAVLAALPPGFLNRLCCLACEELGLYLSNQDYLYAMRSLSGCCACCSVW